jgi:spore maturation protein CgeB
MDLQPESNMLVLMTTDADTARALAGHGLERIRARHTCVHRVDELLAIYRAVSQ